MTKITRVESVFTRQEIPIYIRIIKPKILATQWAVLTTGVQQDDVFLSGNSPLAYTRSNGSDFFTMRGKSGSLGTSSDKWGVFGESAG